MPRPVVDPRFPAELRRLRTTRGLPLRELATLTHIGKSKLGEMEHGQAKPTVREAALLDRALDAGDTLKTLVRPACAAVTPDDRDRVLHAVQHPRRLDVATVDSLATVLAHERRLEDELGSAPMVRPVLARLHLLERLVEEAPDGDRRTALMDVAGQWAQFAGWLATTTGDHETGRHWYMRAMEWATEAGSADMVATSLSMRGHRAWILGQTRSMIELSRAAAWHPAAAGVRALAVQQEARGLAILGDAAGATSRLDQAEELAEVAAEHRDREPPWLYFYDPQYLALQRGLAEQYLRRHDRAAELLSASLDRLPPDIRRADWVGYYVARLAAAYAATGEAGEAAVVLAEARRIAEATGAARLTGEVDDLARKLGL